MTAIMGRQARVIERKGLDPALHFALLDNDQDETDRVLADHVQSINGKLDKIASSQTWLLRTVGAGFVSFITLAAVAVFTHLLG